MLTFEIIDEIAGGVDVLVVVFLQLVSPLTSVSTTSSPIVKIKADYKKDHSLVQ